MSLVVDIGCGLNPFTLADVLVDRSRSLISHYRHRKPYFIIADIEALPFKNRVFGFVHCSHLLEHVEYPKRACLELTRIGTDGQINVPTFFREFLHPEPNHLWIVSERPGCLMFERKPQILHSSNWLSAMSLRAVQLNKHVLLSRYHRIEFRWQDAFGVEVIPYESAI